MENIAFISKKSIENQEELYKKKLKEAVKLNTDFNDLVQRETEFDEKEFSRKISEKSMLINNSLMERIALLQKRGINKIGDFFQQGSYAIENKDAFYSKAVELAKGLGYEASVDLTLSPWLTIKKGNIEIILKYHPAPVFFSILRGQSRIELIEAIKKKSKNESEQVCFYDQEWLIACKDIETQKEIDKIIAVLG